MSERGKHDRIQHNGDELDEVVLTGGMFHIERMDRRRWWMAVYDPLSDKRISFWFETKGELVMLEDCGPLPDIERIDMGDAK